MVDALGADPMACYLSFTTAEQECEGCARAIPPGLVGWTDELQSRRLVALCRVCLSALDPKLEAVQRLAAEAGGE